MPDITLEEFVAELLRERGLDLRGYKPTTLERRIRRRMLQLHLEELSAYLQVLCEQPEELTALLNTVLINVTEFFRDPQAWEFLRTGVLPRMFRNRKPGDSFRCWSAGCANGAEAYSLAITLAKMLGPRMAEFDIRIYGTDIDDDALATARRGEFSPEALRRIPAELRTRYFTENGPVRVSREIRRMVIFGKSSIISDAPISHCDLIVCRNLLIYLDPEAQQRVLHKLHFALEPGGILFLGKAESKLSNSAAFKPLHSRWRFFRKVTGLLETEKDMEAMSESELKTPAGKAEESRMQQEVRRLEMYQRYLFQTLKSAVLMLDTSDVVTSCNEAVQAIWGVAPAKLMNRRFQLTEIAEIAPEITQHMEEARRSGATPQFQCRVHIGREERAISVTIRAIVSEEGVRAGTLFYAEDVTYHGRLQSAVQQLEATSHELQSANEELETTNEELQSTNEELETTNEELQSTNEELETTNEELQSVNEELESLNEELEARSGALDLLSARYAETVRRMPWPLLVLNAREEIEIWNPIAQQVLGISQTALAGVRLDQLPLRQKAASELLRRLRLAVIDRKPQILRERSFATEGAEQVYDVHITPIVKEEAAVEVVLIMFGPPQVKGRNGARKAALGQST